MSIFGKNKKYAKIKMEIDGCEKEITVKRVKSVQGLYYIKKIKFDFNDIITKLDEKNWSPIYDSNSRKVQHYGYKYNYTTRNIYEKCDDIPDFLVKLQYYLSLICQKINIIDDKYEFNQCIVNNYDIGQGITKHTDIKSYGKVIGCFTFNSGCNMIFRKDNKKETIYVKPNSLYIMSGECRYDWTHEMPKGNSDMVDNEKINRSRRISVTFRNVPNKME